jgi:hypothetical protein
MGREAALDDPPDALLVRHPFGAPHPSLEIGVVEPQPFIDCIDPTLD